MDNTTINAWWQNLKNDQNNGNFPLTVFNGYTKTSDHGTVIGLFNKDGQAVKELTGVGFIIFDQTVFYALGGGQISDTGYLKQGTNLIPVYDLNKQIFKKVYVHLVDTGNVTIKINDVLEQEINTTRRNNLTKNHTAQHILSYTIEKIVNDGELTDSVLIKEESFLLAMNKTDNWLDVLLQARDKIITTFINHDIARIEHQMPIAEARAMNLAHPSFEYDPIVRVVEFPAATIDLCGGTHVNNLNEINYFEIWDCWVDKKKVRMESSTNQVATAQYFTTWTNNKITELQQLVDRIKKIDPQFSYQLPVLTTPTTFIEKMALENEIKTIEHELTEISKEKNKLLVQKVNELELEPIIEPINNNLNLVSFTVNDEILTLELMRSKLNKFFQDYQNSLIYFNNPTLKYAYISFTKINSVNFNLNQYFQANKAALNLTGGGTPFFLNITYQDNLDHFMETLLSEIKKS
ncbi:alanyl-tRNA synthetase [Spiroplasma syrphidicola EA-1]|uniref:Alanyl-tRNA synthetase n=1 Tax=Spiroplasma syrphidicola EA-1 TaxID=1276229 RepID=R4U3D3_9MOLU|nr:alanine--tRNA ligase-related protein [Spiroplasma syrphidicola]AGM25912.1 alanyl-tRNA synthetase [Spiroplasma syrphidicola EA-1]